MRNRILCFMALWVLVAIISGIVASPCVAQNQNAQYWLQQAEQASDSQAKLERLTKAVNADSDYWYAYYLRSEAYIGRGDYASAESDAEQAVRFAGRRRERFFCFELLGRTRLALGEYQEAINGLTQAIQNDPRESELGSVLAQAYANRARAEVALGREDDALQDLNESLNVHPAALFARLMRLRLLKNQGRQAEALRDCERMEELVGADAMNEQGWRILAEAQLVLQRWDDTIESCNRALSLRATGPQSHATAYLMRAMARRLNGDSHTAIDDCTKALQIDPDYAAALSERGLNYAMLDQRRPALKDFEAALERQPTNAIALEIRAKLYLQDREWELASRDVERLLRRAQTDQEKSQCFMLFGKIADGKKAWDESAQHYTKAIEFDPSSADAYFERAGTRRIQGNLQGAFEDSEVGLRIAPDSAKGHQVRGRVRSAAGQFELAKDDFRRVIQLDTEQRFTPWSYGYLADLVRVQGEYEQAIQYATRALEGEETLGSQGNFKDAFATAYVVRAAARRAMKQYHQAVDDCDQAIQYDDTHMHAFAERGASRRALGKYDAAIRDCSQAITLAPLLGLPYHERAYATLARFRGEQFETSEKVPELPAILREVALNPNPESNTRRPSRQTAELKTGNLGLQNNRPYVPEPVVNGQQDEGKTHPLDLAVQDFELLLRLGYEPASSGQGLVECLLEMGRFSDALDASNRLLAAQERPEVWSVRAKVHYALGDAEAGLEDAARATSSATPEAHLVAAYGHALMGNWEQCRVECNRGLALTPSGGTAARLLLLSYAATMHVTPGQGLPKDFASQTSSLDISATEWPAPILMGLLDELRFEEFAGRLPKDTDEQITKRRLCQALYYFGVRDIGIQQPTAAKQRFRAATNVGSQQYIEFSLANFELRRMGAF